MLQFLLRYLLMGVTLIISFGILGILYGVRVAWKAAKAGIANTADEDWVYEPLDTFGKEVSKDMKGRSSQYQIGYILGDMTVNLLMWPVAYSRNFIVGVLPIINETERRLKIVIERKAQNGQ